MENLINFPNLTILACYSSISQTVNFNTLSQKNMDTIRQEISSKKFSLDNKNQAKLMAHEAAHFFDNITTLSGRVLLKKIYKAFISIELNAINQNENVKELYSNLLTWKHDNYSLYKEFYGITDNDNKNWSFELKSAFGLDIDKTVNYQNPIFLAEYNYYGTVIGQIPLTIEALWEANAMWAELYYDVTLAYLQEEDIKNIELYRINKEYSEYIYTSDLLIYSLATQLVSSYLDVANIHNAFRLSKVLSTISLNLPYSLYSKLKKPDFKFKNIIEECGDIDPTIVFVYLIFNIKQSGANIHDLLYGGYFEEEFEHIVDASLLKDFKGKKGCVNIDKILEINGLPKRIIIEDLIIKELEEFKINEHVENLTELYNHFSETGNNLFRVHGLSGGVNTNPAFLIDIIDKSNNCIFQNDLQETDAYNRHLYLCEIFKKVKSILSYN